MKELLYEMSLALWVLAMCVELHGHKYKLHQALVRVDNRASQQMMKFTQKQLHTMAIGYT